MLRAYYHKMRCAPTIHQQQHRLIPASRHLAPELLDIPDRLAIDFLNHVALTNARRGSRARGIKPRHHHARLSRRQLELPSDLRREVLNLDASERALVL